MSIRCSGSSRNYDRDEVAAPISRLETRLVLVAVGAPRRSFHNFHPVRSRPVNTPSPIYISRRGRAARPKLGRRSPEVVERLGRSGTHGRRSPTGPRLAVPPYVRIRLRAFRGYVFIDPKPAREQKQRSTGRRRAFLATTLRYIYDATLAKSCCETSRISITADLSRPNDARRRERGTLAGPSFSRNAPDEQGLNPGRHIRLLFVGNPSLPSRRSFLFPAGNDGGEKFVPRRRGGGGRLSYAGSRGTVGRKFRYQLTTAGNV